MAKWIDASDRLPKTNAAVFAFCRLVPRRNQRYIYMAWYSQRWKRWFRIDYGTGVYDVTYWRHMIMPPETQRSEPLTEMTHHG